MTHLVLLQTVAVVVPPAEKMKMIWIEIWLKNIEYMSDRDGIKCN